MDAGLLGRDDRVARPHLPLGPATPRLVNNGEGRLCSLAKQGGDDVITLPALAQDDRGPPGRWVVYCELSAAPLLSAAPSPASLACSTPRPDVCACCLPARPRLRTWMLCGISRHADRVPSSAVAASAEEVGPGQAKEGSGRQDVPEVLEGSMPRRAQP
jgi:hypothetical protein